MKRFTITKLICSMALALLLNSSATAQWGGHFSNPGQNSATPPQPDLQEPKSGGFNSTPFKVTGETASQRPADATPPAPRTAAKPTTFGNPSSFAVQGQTSFGSSPIQPVQMTSNESSGGAASPLPESIDCPISSVHFIEDIRLPAKEAGAIQTMNFKEGDFVPAGQIVAQIDDEEFRLLLEQAEMRYKMAVEAASDATGVLAAKKKFQVSSIEAKKTDRLHGTGSKSASDKMMANYSKEIAYLEMQKAGKDRQTALSEAQMAANEKVQVQSKIDRHTLRSEFDGYVVEILKHKQEYVQAGEEVVRLARMDRVWVQSVVDTKELNAHELMNRKVTVTIQLARGETAEFEGMIKFVGLERQGPELLMVKAEVANRPINSHWILHPEAEVSMKIHLNEPAN